MGLYPLHTDAVSCSLQSQVVPQHPTMAPSIRFRNKHFKVQPGMRFGNIKYPSAILFKCLAACLGNSNDYQALLLAQYGKLIFKNEQKKSMPVPEGP